MAAAALPVALGLSALATGAQVYQTAKSKVPKPPPLPQLPELKKEMPDVGVQGERERRKAAGITGRTGTILTGPRGVTTPIVGERKTLLGQ